eukprot:TRINITY_DN5442_c0_g1_i2.p1 TRINITY_DN5442_c0_g1~~TRINITY_DN5442_c0_g1_i2.p1  ORF type:complete len:192 (-),score=25.91 TRINITY_DN5442_c0_g1_i2:58-633(-)
MMLPQTNENAPQMATNYTTLDEPVWATLWRDVRRVGIKLWHVLIPRGGSEKALRDWDLWGPLVFCLILALLLTDSAAEVFVIVWVGAVVVTLNSQLLGGKISFFQSVCVLGYCVFPLVVAALVIWAVHEAGWSNFFFRFGISMGCFGWSIWASIGFLAGMVPPHRKLLAAYPVILFFLALAWLVMVHFTAS